MTTQPEDGSRETLGERMKRYEAATDQQLPNDQPALLRIDGHGFSKFTRGFSKPFDQRMHDTMAQTAADLLEYFPAASLAYTQSDEITLVFPATATGRPFNSRVGKLASLAAGYASTRFNHHLAKAADIPANKHSVAHFYPHRGRTAFRVDGITCCLLTPAMFNHCESSYCKSSESHSTRLISQKSQRRLFESSKVQTPNLTLEKEATKL
ncbi:tRNAHis guanylyltransferase-domain-containing protein [Mycena olivaceomarginata]|nr:tRNAHis guanylyltransferase-domain-containing protein [Mycena olivaceomarginata]